MHRRDERSDHTTWTAREHAAGPSGPRAGARSLAAQIYGGAGTDRGDAQAAEVHLRLGQVLSGDLPALERAAALGDRAAAERGRALVMSQLAAIRQALRDTEAAGRADPLADDLRAKLASIGERADDLVARVRPAAVSDEREAEWDGWCSPLGALSSGEETGPAPAPAASGSPLDLARAGTRHEGEVIPFPRRAAIERSFGRAIPATAHAGPAAEEACRPLDASAYEIGGRVASADRSPGLHTAAHEAAHVLQGTGGVSRKAAHAPPGADALEVHADRAADLAVRG